MLIKRLLLWARWGGRSDLIIDAARALSWLGAICCFVASAFLCGCTQQAPLEPRDTLPAFFAHKVKYQGETLSLIAGWYTGNARNWPKIAEANRGLKPERIKPGDWIQIPYELVTKETPLPERALGASKNHRLHGGVTQPAAEGLVVPDVSGTAPAVNLPVYTANEQSARSLQAAAEVSPVESGSSVPQPDVTAPAEPVPAEPETVTLTREELLRELAKE